MLDDHLPDFGGKLACIYVSGKSYVRYILQDIAFDMQGGRLFVVGRIPEDYDMHVPWAKGKPAAIAWDCVDYYIVFESVEQFRDALQKSRIHKAAEGNNDIQVRPNVGGFVSNWLRKRK
jgi:hypothetical protein